MVKPFAFSELIARIQGLLRRSAQHQPESTCLALHDLEMDLARRKVSRNGQRIDLSAKEFLLLSLFLRKQGEVLSRTEIAEQVWDMNFDSNTNVVEVSIKRLRAKMDTPFELQLLRARTRHGLCPRNARMKLGKQINPTLSGRLVRWLASLSLGVLGCLCLGVFLTQSQS